MIKLTKQQLIEKNEILLKEVEFLKNTLKNKKDRKEIRIKDVEILKSNNIKLKANLEDKDNKNVLYDNCLMEISSLKKENAELKEKLNKIILICDILK